jgi:hypothetical protein
MIKLLNNCWKLAIELLILWYFMNGFAKLKAQILGNLFWTNLKYNGQGKIFNYKYKCKTI